MSAETVRIMCPNLTCRKLLAVPAAARGKMVRCRSCSTNIRVPNIATKSATPGAAASPATPESSPQTKKAG